MLASGKYETSNPAETKKREGIGKNACIGPMTQKRGASAPLFYDRSFSADDHAASRTGCRICAVCTAFPLYSSAAGTRLSLRLRIKLMIRQAAKPPIPIASVSKPGQSIRQPPTPRTMRIMVLHLRFRKPTVQALRLTTPTSVAKTDHATWIGVPTSRMPGSVAKMNGATNPPSARLMPKQKEASP